MTLLPKVKLKAMVNFPATVLDGTGIDVVKSNGSYQFNLDFSDFAPPVGSVSDAANQNALLWNSVTGSYTLAPMALLAGGIDQNSQSVDYTTVLSDAQKHLLHPTADTTARTFTIAANASVAYPIGTAISFVNQHGAGVLTIACGDTMYLASAGTTGNRTLAASGVCTALKITATEWIIAGKGLT